MRVCNGRQDGCQWESAIMRPNKGRQAHSAADGLALSAAKNRTAQIAKGDSGLCVVIDGSIIPTSPASSYRTCVRREVPPRWTSSVVFLDKLFSVSLVAPDKRGAGQNVLYKSSVFVRICSPESSGGVGEAVLVGEQHDGGKSLGRRGAATSTQDRREESQEHPAKTAKGVEMDYCQFFLKTNTPEAWPKSLSLKEALELYRPDFISQSQGRVRMMEQRKRRGKTSADLIRDEDVRRRRCTTCAGLVRDGDVRKRKCTTPDPLSDNLFKPSRRSISIKEMQQRSRRLYNKLPEVEKKKQEEEKRTVFQANRLRVELFKKRLLDHILQR
ncbi:uncharacterized protein LOC133158237 [Syngnathus typhle]|uniref:uncharacterized protein LOC133158237 n=1 Tax=Syngnathus typhle TaxID=161592 RepID=UPI002A6A1697|nr:uncharacterized protein LOC133158237 [Syngnathus typhle]XP_061141262.1 uncharacterized protein LOC133158237 [Syngnathus typhle]XP_061141263.1 uncharacterized protein LOC133158237 [Syngnathus typhle]